MKNLSALALLLGASLAVPGVASAQSVFTGSGTGAIPDNGAGGPATYGTPLDVTFTVAGLVANISDVSLSITMAHTYIGDLDVRLFRPGADVTDPAQGFVIFSRVGAAGAGNFGDADNLVDTPAYVFIDGGSSLWAATDNVTSHNILSGNYRTGAPGGGGGNDALTTFATDSGFVGLTPGTANGTWTLRFRDGATSDSGSVSASSLTITEVPEPAHYAIAAGLGLLAFAGYRRYSQAKA